MGAISSSSHGQVIKGSVPAEEQKAAAGKAGQSVSTMASAHGAATPPVKMPEVAIRTITWTRESHGLFDFEIKENEHSLFIKK